MKYEISIITARNSEVDSFIDEHGTVFQTFEFLSAVGDDYEAVVAKSKDEIVGVLPLVKTIKFKLNAYHIPPFAYQFGPVVMDDDKSFDVVEALLKSVPDSGQKDFKMLLGKQDSLPFVQSGFTMSVNQSHRIVPNTEYSLNNIHKSKRRYLKKLLAAQKEGSLQVKEGLDCLEDLFFLYKETAEQSNFRSSIEKLKSIISGLPESRYYIIVVYDNQNNPLSGAFCPFDAKYAYHLINASVRNEDSMLDKANILSTYLAVQKAVEMGRGFDFEGSNIPGIASFYRMMGGIPTFVYRAQKTKSLYYQVLRFLDRVKYERS